MLYIIQNTITMKGIFSTENLAVSCILLERERERERESKYELYTIGKPYSK